MLSGSESAETEDAVDRIEAGNTALPIRSRNVSEVPPPNVP